jgi:hypothetical protein
LLGISGVLIDAHRRRWRAIAADGTMSDTNRRYAQSEFRRRMQASSAIGVVGAMIGIWPIVPRHPLWISVYLALLLLATLAILLLAVLDIWATSQRFHRLRTAQQIIQARLTRELEQPGSTANPKPNAENSQSENAWATDQH